VRYLWLASRVLFILAFAFGATDRKLFEHSPLISTVSLLFPIIGGAVVTRSWFALKLPGIEFARPSWFESPLSLSNPLQGLHLGSWAFVVTGILSVGATSELRFDAAVGAFGLGILLGIRWGLSRLPHNDQPAA
jgi:hypothetical protein